MDTTVHQDHHPPRLRYIPPVQDSQVCVQCDCDRDIRTPHHGQPDFPIPEQLDCVLGRPLNLVGQENKRRRHWLQIRRCGDNASGHNPRRNILERRERPARATQFVNPAGPQPAPDGVHLDVRQVGPDRDAVLQPHRVRGGRRWAI